VSSDSKHLLAVRTILVTTRAAIQAHQESGKEDLARATANRGAELLRRLGQGLPPDAGETIERSYREAEREMEGLLVASSDEPRGDR
jgi:hypothetical protein